MQLHIAICEDEAAQRELLQEKLTDFSLRNGLEFTVAEFDSAAALLSDPLDYDLLFLDIQLEQEQNGIDMGKKLRNGRFRGVIVIVTAYEQFLPEGYTIEAYRYLMKPVTQCQIDEVLQGVLARLAEVPHTITVKCTDGVRYIDTDEIVMVESYYRRRRIHLPDEVVETREALAEIFGKLPAGQFAYAQKSYFVSFRHVMKEHNNLLTLRGGTELFVTRTKLREFMLAFGRYMQMRR